MYQTLKSDIPKCLKPRVDDALKVYTGYQWQYLDKNVLESNYWDITCINSKTFSFWMM